MKDDEKEMETTSALELIDEANEHPDLEPEVDETIVPDGFVLTEQGLYKLVPLKDGSYDFQWICDWIHVKALTENIEGRENGILVELRTRPEFRQRLSWQIVPFQRLHTQGRFF